MRIIRYVRAPRTTSWRGLRTRLAKLNFAKILPQYKGRAISENYHDFLSKLFLEETTEIEQWPDTFQSCSQFTASTL